MFKKFLFLLWLPLISIATTEAEELNEPSLRPIFNPSLISTETTEHQELNETGLKGAHNPSSSAIADQISSLTEKTDESPLSPLENKKMEEAHQPANFTPPHSRSPSITEVEGEERPDKKDKDQDALPTDSPSLSAKQQKDSRSVEELAAEQSPNGFHRNLSFILDYGSVFGNVLALCPKIATTTGLSISTSLSSISMVGSLFTPYYDEGTSKLLKAADASLSLLIPIANICALRAEEDDANKERLNNLALTLTVLKAGVSTTIHRQKEAKLKERLKKE